MALIDKASLLMVPSVYEDGTLYNVLPSGNKAPDETGSHNGYDQTRADFTFSRGFNLAATRVNASGLIEKGRENLFTQSNNFGHSDWNVKTGTFTQGVADPDGGNNAWSWTATNTDPYLYQSGKSTSGVSVLSIWVKGVGFTIGKYFEFRIGGTPYYNFVLTGEWQRLEYYVNHSSGGSSVGWEYGNPAVVGDVVHIYQAQYEVGTIATAYMDSGATTATAGVLENTPRIDYSSGAGALLLEPSRSNLITYGNYLNGFTTKSQISVTTNAAISPDGTKNASKLIPNTSNVATHYIAQTVTVVSGNDYVISFFAKKGEYNYVNTYTSAYSTGSSATWDLNAGTVILGGSNASIEDYGNGWYRCIWKGTTNTTSLSYRIYVSEVENRNTSFAGDGVKGAYAYGAQIEAGSYASSLIPTHGAAATRGADSCSVTGASDVIPNEGVFYIDMSIEDFENYTSFFQLSEGTNTSIRFWAATYSGSTGLFGQIYVQGVDVKRQLLTETKNERIKAAIRYDSGDIAFYVNGSQLYKGTETFTPEALTIIDNFKLFGNSEVKSGGSVYGLGVFPVLSDSELATLTTL